MKTSMRTLGMALYLTIAGMSFAATVQAGDHKGGDHKGGDHKGGDKGGWNGDFGNWGSKGDKGGKSKGDHAGRGVPEVGGHGAPAALALAFGGVAVMAGRRRKREEA